MHQAFHPARRSFIATAAAVALAAGGLSAQAQTYPARPLELVVPFPAGGGTDVLGRAYAEAAHKFFPQPIVVVNKPGAIGTIGYAYGAGAKPDGYVVTMIVPELLIAPYVNVGKTSFEEFTPIARINADPGSITVRADAPWKTVEEFLAYAKSKPGEVSISTSGSGSIYHLAAAAVEDKAGVKFNHVPYQGESPAILGLLSSQVDATAVSPGALSAHVKAGKLRILAVMSNQRLKSYENVPTLKERNIDVAMGTWRGLAVPKGTPPDVVKQLRELTQKVNDDPKYRETVEKQNIGLLYEDGDAFAASLKRENEDFRRLVPKLSLSK